jgi:hypothetical protein
VVRPLWKTVLPASQGQWDSAEGVAEFLRAHDEIVAALQEGDAMRAGGLMGGFVFRLMGGLVGGLVGGLAFGLAFALVVGLGPAVELAWKESLWALCGSPVRFVPLLQTALERQVLRQAGAVYQFRHAALQDLLAFSRLARMESAGGADE